MTKKSKPLSPGMNGLRGKVNLLRTTVLKIDRKSEVPLSDYFVHLQDGFGTGDPIETTTYYSHYIRVSGHVQTHTDGRGALSALFGGSDASEGTIEWDLDPVQFLVGTLTAPKPLKFFTSYVVLAFGGKFRVFLDMTLDWKVGEDRYVDVTLKLYEDDLPTPGPLNLDRSSSPVGTATASLDLSLGKSMVSVHVSDKAFNGRNDWAILDLELSHSVEAWQKA